jgi:hypothetical protein
MEDLGIEGKVILKWSIRNLGGRVWTGFIGPRIGFSKGIL